MRTELGYMPQSPFEIRPVGREAVISFYENVEPVVREESQAWAVDEYRLTVLNRSGLEDSIENNLQAWMDMAKAAENISPPPTLGERVGVVEGDIELIAEVLSL
jgi:hypothetical protein